MTLPDISRLSALPAEKLRAFGQRLASLGLTLVAAQPVVEAARVVAPQLRKPIVAYHLRKMSTPVALAMRMFMFEDPVTPEEAKAVLADLHDELLAAGLVAHKDGGVVSPFVLGVVDDLYIFSDALHHGHDAVMGLGETTIALARAAFPRKPLRDVLDLGCGSGTVALFFARTAQRTIGTDINPRAVALARINAAINGVKNAEFREGDRFAPVAGISFDLIVSQPPFVSMPEAAGDASALYGGRRGDELVLSILSQTKDHLSARGRAVFFIEWPEYGEDPLERRVRAAVGEGADTLIVRAPPTSLDANAVSYAAGFHLHLGRSFEEDAIARRRHFDAVGIRALIPTLTVIARAASGAGWTSVAAIEPFAQVALDSERLDKMFAARAIAGQKDKLLASKLKVPEGTVLSQVQIGPGADVPSTIHARLPATVGAPEIDMTLELLLLITFAHEEKTLKDAAVKFAEQMEISLDDAIAKMVPATEEALAHGILELA
jgi:methylase of polypeptide subunit release factors